MFNINMFSLILINNHGKIVKHIHILLKWNQFYRKNIVKKDAIILNKN